MVLSVLIRKKKKKLAEMATSCHSMYRSLSFYKRSTESALIEFMAY